MGAPVLSAVAADGETTSPIPLERGTKWVYAAEVKWTPLARDGHPAIQSARMKWTTEVLDCVQGNSVRAAVVYAFPTGILGLDPVKPEGYTVLIEASNRLYSASAHSARKARKLAREFVGAPEKLAGKTEILLELPLHADKRWGGDEYTAERRDGWYCWRVEAVKAQRLKVKGLPAGEYFDVRTVAYRTCPDHQVLDIADGVGITRLEYEHHGTVGCEHVRLVQFERGH